MAQSHGIFEPLINIPILLNSIVKNGDDVFCASEEMGDGDIDRNSNFKAPSLSFSSSASGGIKRVRIMALKISPSPADLQPICDFVRFSHNGSLPSWKYHILHRKKEVQQNIDSSISFH